MLDPYMSKENGYNNLDFWPKLVNSILQCVLPQSRSTDQAARGPEINTDIQASWYLVIQNTLFLGF